LLAKPMEGSMQLRFALAVTFACLPPVAAAIFALFAFRPDLQPASAAPASNAQANAVPVVAEPVKQGEVPIYLRGIGTVQAYNTVTVRSQITGQITQIPFAEGQTVHVGDLLAQIDPRPYQAQLDQATANRARDQAQLANAEQLLQRNTPLLAEGYTPAQTVETEKDQVAQYEAMVQSDTAQIENAQVELGYTRLTSPINGVVGIRQIDIGNIIHPTDPNGLVVVTQLQPISVIFTLPEGNLPQIQQAMAKGELTALAYSQDDKVQLDQGTLAVLDNQIIQTSGSVRLKANFPNPAHHLWPGQLIDIRLRVETLPDALTVAATAVQQGPSGPYVYAINLDGTVEQRPITVGQTAARRVLVTSGLKAGEQIVSGGQSRLQAGSRVTVLTGQAAEELASQSGSGMVIP
ncbi:MAG TPA: efflux RND transporter periplasmic adaptor subunit, partial [Stellaceae bacterium]|nr:efflux RND transporter periplasmic adaptor subunit [Stellaceae bacterium]